jgi:hypothetical protein
MRLEMHYERNLLDLLLLGLGVAALHLGLVLWTNHWKGEYLRFRAVIPIQPALRLLVVAHPVHFDELLPTEATRRFKQSIINQENLIPHFVPACRTSLHMQAFTITVAVFRPTSGQPETCD